MVEKKVVQQAIGQAAQKDFSRVELTAEMKEYEMAELMAEMKVPMMVELTAV